MTVTATIVLVTASLLAGRGDGVGSTGTVSLDSGSSGSATSVADRSPIHVPTISVGEARVKHSKGTAPLPESAVSSLDIPVTALLAYQRAAAVMGAVDQSCGLSWTLLAAIGRVESDHGRYAGAQLGSDGVSTPAIRGVALNGAGPVAAIRDTDAGRLDGDTVWDRAVGPMQFLPSTWSDVAVDGDSDGVRSPDDIDDAALATAVFLCSAPGTLATTSGRETAVFRYNPSSAYVASVLEIERAYRNGNFDTSGALAQAGALEVAVATPSGVRTVSAGSGGGHEGGGHHKHGNTGDAGGGQGTGDGSGHHGSDPASDPTSDPTDDGTPGSTDPTDPGSTDPTDPGSSGPTDPGSTDPGSSGPTDPGSTDPTDPGTTDPTPDTPDPTPDPDPTPVTIKGVLARCGPEAADWCIGDVLLDVGDVAVRAADAAPDFDADGTVESNAEELNGLVGLEVTVLATPGTDPAFVLSINGAAYNPQP